MSRSPTPRREVYVSGKPPVVFGWRAPCCGTQQPMEGRKRVQGRDGHPTWRCAVCEQARIARRAVRS